MFIGSDNMEIDEDEETTTAIHSQQFPQNDPLNMENLEDQTQSRDDEVEEIIPQSSGIDTSISNQWSEPTIINVDELAVALENLGLRGVRQLLTPYKSPADLKDSDSDMGPQQPLRPFREGGSDTESYSTQDQLRRCRRASADTRNERDRSLTFGPYHEISVFPARPKKFSRMTWDAYVTKVNREWQIEGERLISTLQSPTLCNKERISILDRLLSLENSMLSSNSSTCEELLTVLRGETKCDRRRITKIYFHLIERYINTSQIQRVPNLIREYLNELKSDEKNDFVKLELLFLQAHYLYHLDQSNKAEHLIRRVIWFAFTRFGPYHDFTIHALHLYNMIKERLSKGTFIEAENIYRFNISICSGEVADFNFELWYSNATSLVWYFGLNRRYEEAQSLCTYVMKRAELVFGTDSGVYISCRIEQAHIWRKQGKISESLNLLYLLSGNSNLSERAKYKISNDIGFILMEMKDYSKAEIWYRKTLESSVIMYGLQHPCILVNCENLGYCFEMLGRWSAALRLYRKFLERLRKCRGVDQSSVEKVEGWISRGEREIEMIAQEKESGKNENTDGGANTEGAGDMESEQSQALNDSDGIDWDELHAKSPSAFYVV
jgi:tetratricopeptide (TPR) repeat protein